MDLRKLKPKIEPAKLLSTLSFLGVSVLTITTFFKDQTLRWVMIVCLAIVVLLALGIPYLFHRYYKRRTNALINGIDNENARAADSLKESERERANQLRAKFKEGVDRLRKSKKKIYEIPWILQIGEPQSGKTTLIRGSQMQFPVGDDGIQGLGGTRNCDWFFTNEAVILDTAGRFAFHGGGEPDRAEWERFLELLTKYRPDAPINGVIVVIPATSLLADAAQDRKTNALRIRARLREAQEQFGVQFPVFVVITKCDMVLGFSEFFRDFSNVQSAQMLGWSNHATVDQPYDSDRFVEDFNAVYRRLRAHRLTALKRPAKLELRGLICTFPEAFRSLMVPLQEYLKEMFAKDIYHEPLFFRGFYFTSGMQQGRPIISEGVAPLRGRTSSAISEKEFDKLGDLFPPKPFFCADLFQSKVLKETGLVCRSIKQLTASKMRKWITIGGGTGLSLLFVILLGWGGIRAKTWVQEPTVAAMQACMEIKSPEDCPPNLIGSDKFKPGDLLTSLRNAAENLKSPGWLLRTTFISKDLNQPGQWLEELHNRYFLKVMLRPKVEELERHLAKEWKTDVDENAKRDSLHEYLAWYVGAQLTKEPNVAFDRLFKPISDSDPLADLESLKTQFIDLFGSKSQHASQITPLLHLALNADEPFAVDGKSGNSVDLRDPRLKAMIEAAKEHFVYRFAGEHSDYLGNWVQLFRDGENAKSKLQELIGLEPKFGSVRTINTYANLKTEWNGHHEEFHKLLMAFKDGFHKLSTPGGGKNKAATLPVSPTLDKMQDKWTKYFGVAHVPGESLDAMLPRNVSGEERFPIVHRWLTEAVKAADDEAGRVIKDEINAKREKENYLEESGHLSESFSCVEKEITVLNDSLKVAEQSPYSSEPNVDNWDFANGPEPSTQESGGEQKKPGGKKKRDSAVEESYKTVDCGVEGLAKLEVAIDRAAKLRTTYGNLQAIEEQLASNDFKIEDGREGANDEVPIDISGFKNLKSKDTGVFLQETTRRIAKLQSVLSACIDDHTLFDDAKAKTGAKSALESSSGTKPSAEVPLELNPAKRVSERLSAAASAYYGRFFSEWAKRYREDILYERDDLRKANKWNDYFLLLFPKTDDKEDSGSEKAGLWGSGRKAVRRLKILEESVISVEVPLRGDPVNAVARDYAYSVMNTLIKRIEVMRGGSSYCKQMQFDDLISQHKAFETARQHKTPTGSSLAEAVKFAFDDYSQSIGKLGAELGRERNAKPISGGPDPKTDLEALCRLLPSDLTIRQLLDIERRGRYLLSKEIDNRIGQALVNFKGYSYADCFPFKEDGATEVPDMAMRRFLFELETLKSRLGPLDEHQQGFVDRCEKWRDFLYVDSSGTQVDNWKPRVCLFEIKYREPSHTKISENDFTTAILYLGCTGMTTNEPKCGKSNGRPIEFKQINNVQVAPKGAYEEKCWRFGEQEFVRIEFIDPPAGGGLEEYSHPIFDTVWGLPRLIHMYSGDPVRDVGDTVRWEFDVDVELGERTVFIGFSVKFLDKVDGKLLELPKPIGEFKPDTSVWSPVFQCAEPQDENHASGSP